MRTGLGLLNKGAALVAVTVFLSACSSPPRLSGNHTAAEQFAALRGTKERRVASTFYDLGRGDVVQSEALARRNGYVLPGPVNRTSAAEPALQRSYVEVPVPAHRTSDGTEIEESNVVVETVK